MSRRWIALLLVANLAVRLAVAFRPLAVIDGRTIPDDAYLSLEIARNIAHGLGPWYSNAHTNGFQPLYVFLMVPAFWLFHGDPEAPVRVALVLLSMFDVATLWLLVRLVASFSASQWPPVLTAVAWIGNPYVIRTSLNGLETAVATFCFVWALSLFSTWRHANWLPSRSQAAQLGAVIGLAALARIDSWFLGAALFVVATVCNRARLRVVAARMLRLAVVALAVYAPWLVYSYAYTGDVYPVSGQAVRLLNIEILEGKAPTWHNWYAPSLENGLRTMVESNAPCLIAVTALGILALVRRRSWPARLQVPVMVASMLYAAFLFLVYTLYQFGSWYFGRYLYPIAIVLILGCGALFELAATGAPRWRRLEALAVVTILVVGFMLHPDTRRLTVPSGQKNRTGYMQVALWAAKNFPPGTVLGAPQSGALGYFARDLKVVNLDGVVNKECLRSIMEWHHVDYMRVAGVQWVLAWGLHIRFILRRSPGVEADVLIVRATVPDVESWGNNWYVAELVTKAP